MPQKNVSVSAEGQRVILNFSAFADVLELFQQFGSARKRADFADRLGASLSQMGLALEVRVAGKTVDVFGLAGEAGLLRRLVKG